MGFRAAQFPIDLMGIHDVVTMSATGSSLQIRRTVEMADTERREIIQDSRGGGETKARVQLHPVSSTDISRHDGELSAIEIQGKLLRRPCDAAPLLRASIGPYPTQRPTRHPIPV